LTEWIRISAGDIHVAVDPDLGNIRAFEHSGREVLHTAHWVQDTKPATVDLPVERKLAGDFFCAPFGGSGVQGVPAHGWTANSRWSLISKAQNSNAAVVKLELDRDVFGARVTKELRLLSGHPTLYQKHTIEGGQGPLSYAHHPMVHMRDGGHIGLSAKACALTPAQALEPKHLFKYPSQATDLSKFPMADGGAFDLHTYPQAHGKTSAGHEDFITLVEAPNARFGWTAVTRKAEGDIVIFLKDPRSAPVTMLWYSNGGRDYAPWDGKHCGVLGVEDGCTAGAGTLEQAGAPNAISNMGVPTVLQLSEGARTEIRHAIVSVPCPAGWTGVANVTLVEAGTLLRLTSLSGAELDVPFDGGFL
jgi:hypothetical protein